VLEVMFEYCPWGISYGWSGGAIRDGAGGGMSGGPALFRCRGLCVFVSATVAMGICE
jgi:hypothetical protein